MAGSADEPFPVPSPEGSFRAAFPGGTFPRRVSRAVPIAPVAARSVTFV